MSGMSRQSRKRIKEFLWKEFGEDCCWCGKPMVFPQYGFSMGCRKDMATVEHHYAKEFNRPNEIMLFRLSHNKCNI